MKPPTCDICNGTGEVTYFRGVSRFLLSHEACPSCHGTGFSIDEDADETKLENNSDDCETDI